MPGTQDKKWKFFCCKNLLSGKSHCCMIIIIRSRFAAMELRTEHTQKYQQNKGKEKCSVQKKSLFEQLPFFQFPQIITGNSCLKLIFSLVFFHYDFSCCMLQILFYKKYNCEILFSTFSMYFYRIFTRGSEEKSNIFFRRRFFLLKNPV